MKNFVERYFEQNGKQYADEYRYNDILDMANKIGSLNYQTYQDCAKMLIDLARTIQNLRDIDCSNYTKPEPYPFEG